MVAGNDLALDQLPGWRGRGWRRSRFRLGHGAGPRFETVGKLQPQRPEDLPPLRRHRVGRVPCHLARHPAGAVSRVLDEEPAKNPEDAVPEHISPALAET